MAEEDGLTLFAGQLVTPERAWSTSDLRALQQRIFSCLREHGIGHGTRVGLALADAALYLSATWATRACGGVAVLLSSSSTSLARESATLVSCVADCEPHVVLVDSVHVETLSASLAASGADILLVSNEGVISVVVRGTTRTRAPHPSDAALICYTSGTERMRKGVILSRPTLDLVLRGSQNLFNHSPGETFLSCLPLNHMTGFNHTSQALFGGSRVVVCPNFTWMGEVVDLIARHRVTAAVSVPFQLFRLVQQQEFSSFTHLRQLWFAGSSVVAKDIVEANRLLPELRIGNIYGLTEALRSSILWPDEIPERLPSIGRPNANVEIELRDEGENPILSVEARGIAWIRGPNLMLGYWNRPAETAAVLKDGWFCTNDIMRRSTDGYLWIEGRSAEVLNCSGEKLSPEVLERYISAACPVSEVAVLGLRTGEAVDEIVAVVVSPQNVTVTLEDVRSACLAHVHSGFAPQRVVHVDRLPWKQEGKLDRKALRKLIEAGRT